MLVKKIYNKGLQIPLYVMGPLNHVLVLQRYVPLSQYAEKIKRKMELKWELKWHEMIMVTMIVLMAKNEWKTLLVITKYWVKLEIGK